VDHNIEAAARDGRRMISGDPNLKQYTAEALMAVPLHPRPDEDLEDVASYLLKWVRMLPPGEREEAWLEAGGALLGKQWPEYRRKAEEKMSTADFTIELDEDKGSSVLVCAKCPGVEAELGEVDGLRLHAVVSMALAHKARVHAEEEK
jgi:hypothetical protein